LKIESVGTLVRQGRDVRGTAWQGGARLGRHYGTVMRVVEHFGASWCGSVWIGRH